MNLRKTAIILAAAACVLLCMPRASSLADASQSILPGPQTKTAYSSAEDDGKEAEAVVSLQDGDTVLFNDQDGTIGTLQVDSANGTILFFTDQSAEGKAARILYNVPGDSSEQWLRYSVGAGSNPVYLLLVSVWVEDENISTKGWINVANVLNFAEIAELDNAPLLAEIKTLQGKIDAAAQTPTPTPLPTATPQSKAEPTSIIDQLLNNLIIVSFLVAILALLICVLIVLINMKRKEAIRYSREKDRRKRDIKECLDESLLPSIDQTVRVIAKKIEDQSGDYRYMETTVREIGRKLGEPEKPPKKDWEELAEIANSAMNEASYEKWKQVFLAKDWIPQAVQAAALNIPGEFEIAEFGMAHSFAAFAAHDPDLRERLYVIPSITDRDLRSRQIVDLFEISRTRTTDSSLYKVVKPAVLYSIDGRFYKVHSKGKIQIWSRE